MIAAGWVDKRWALFVVTPPRRWWRGRAVLLGDAAHGMLPHQGQGANTTIEDATVLARLISASAAPDWEQVFATYARLRQPRTRAIQRSSWATNRLLHLADGDPGIPRRDRRMAGFPDGFGWIHAHDALASAEAAKVG
jgi:salicylate hydroxylase